MIDYWVKITEKEEDEIRRHHYLVTAADEREARRVAMDFVRHFCDEDDDPEVIKDGYSFFNRAVTVQITDIRETTREEFKDFLLKIHTIQWK
ncbi:MAG TPA: hypothetical protein PK836_10385 [Syntrophales bacterium]|nr:hypothetical protein [Syntrophales bacterium]HOM08201.1 hypothetical protein [Syntrophales bacterium]HOO00850.1 hypothetical protein [Syntrophales bacterium]HPC02067.1 hypothetical protein [Syntrophales bacterium]HPQ07078.1 hypothetical protein [Syntrophales bacterium]